MFNFGGEEIGGDYRFISIAFEFMKPVDNCCRIIVKDRRHLLTKKGGVTRRLVLVLNLALIGQLEQHLPPSGAGHGSFIAKRNW
jgi:hypothetical protein